MVILSEILGCVNFEKNGIYFNEKVAQINIKVASRLCGNLIKLYFNKVDLPYVHQASACLLKIHNKQSQIALKVKPFFNKENSRIMSCLAYSISTSRYNTEEIITKLRARCLI